GLEALWLEGHRLPDLFTGQASAAEAAAPGEAALEAAPVQGRRRWTLAGLFRDGPDLPVAACYLSYFGLAFFALRWWKMADRRRSHRFSLFAVLAAGRSEEHTSELQSQSNLVCRLLLEKKKNNNKIIQNKHTPQMNDSP